MSGEREILMHVVERPPRGEVVFALARGVASVVALSAVVLLSVLVIVAKTLIMLVAERVGVVVIFLLVISCVVAAGVQLGFSVPVMLRVLMRCCV